MNGLSTSVWRGLPQAGLAAIIAIGLAMLAPDQG